MTCQRFRLEVTGAVQGVGFRPFVHRLAADEGLAGFVQNTGEGAALEVEGAGPAVARFLRRLDDEISPPAGITARHSAWLAPRGERAFVIAPSTAGGTKPAGVLPDLATCSECLAEILDPANRRYRYAFTTCTCCGPRYSIIEAVPYDRACTVMRHFALCAACQAEYDDPASRRFHAQTNACAVCGPRLTLLDAEGNATAAGDAALLAAAMALRRGGIVALKGLGGFHLLGDARSPAVLRRLRLGKQRPAKPFAMMVASLSGVRVLAVVSAEEERVLRSTAAPIVLLRALPETPLLAPGVAPDNPWLGIMLPATPLQHLLLRELDFPVVATSGNRSGEPIIADEREVVQKLTGIADVFLVHDRSILRPLDDSIVQVVAERETVLRHARGYAPQNLAAPSVTAPCIALGGQQKNAVAIAACGEIVLGPHIGDLNSFAMREVFARTVDTMRTLYRLDPRSTACDPHPGYYSTRFAEQLGPATVRVPHHLAHVLACMADNGLEGPVLGVAWDGTGYGGDNTIWGGEFLAVEAARWRRLAYLVPFRLPGGETAIREPRRAAFGALQAAFGEAAFDMVDLPPIAAFQPAERKVLQKMLAGALNTPLTSSAGRLFDAVAAILGLCQIASFEGEAAMALEHAAMRAKASFPLPALAIMPGAGPVRLDWRPMLAALVAARRDGILAPALAAGFHDALTAAIVMIAVQAELRRVLLTGGCFQNRRLTEATIASLRLAGFEPYWHHRIPPNDGGLAVGQAVFAARPLLQEPV